MKIALCLSGYFGTLSENNFTTGQKGYKHIKEKLGDLNEVDVFVHCWQPEFEQKIEKLYNPKRAKYERQIDFSVYCRTFGIDQSHIDEGFDRKNTMYKNATYERIMSFYYSRCCALEYATNYASENNFEYDWIICTRFDISCRGGVEVNQLKFDENLDNNFIYTAYWNQMNCGYGDMWFFSNQYNMSKYKQLFDHCLSDFQPNSQYEMAATTGWPDSQWFEVHSHYDGRQFSNEFLLEKEEKSKNLMKYPKWCLSNSHLYHKWFFIETGLYSKTKWI